MGAPKHFLRDVKATSEAWQRAREIVSVCESIKDTGRHKRSLRDVDAEAALRSKVSLTDFTKRMSVQESMQKFLLSVGKRKSMRGAVGAQSEPTLSPEQLSQLALRDLIQSTGDIGAAVRLSEELKYRDKMMRESVGQREAGTALSDIPEGNSPTRGSTASSPEPNRKSPLNWAPSGVVAPKVREKVLSRRFIV